MRNGLILLTASALIGSGCATVDLKDMTGASATSSDLQVETDRNVVQRAVDKLRAAFESRGFGEKASQRKMHAAADMLLNGLSAKSVSGPEEGYAMTVRPVPVVLEDIRLAQRHVEQTTRAARIYLEVAPADRKLEAELKSLQEALMASEGAAKAFNQALPGEGSPELERYRNAVDDLRDITDEFGARVRLTRSETRAKPSEASVG